MSKQKKSVNHLKPILSMIQDILDNEDNAGCEDDLTVTSKSACDKIRAYISKHSKDLY